MLFPPRVPSLVPAVTHQPDGVKTGWGAPKKARFIQGSQRSLLTVLPQSTWHLYPRTQAPQRGSTRLVTAVFFPSFWSPCLIQWGHSGLSVSALVSRGCIYLKQPPLRSSSRRSLSSLCIANVKFAISVSCSGFNSFSARYFSSLVLIQKTKYSCSGCVTQLQTLPHLVVSSFAQFGKF